MGIVVICGFFEKEDGFGYPTGEKELKTIGIAFQEPDNKEEVVQRIIETGKGAPPDGRELDVTH